MELSPNAMFAITPLQRQRRSGFKLLSGPVRAQALRRGR
jgi:hypothetical protein